MNEELMDGKDSLLEEIRQLKELLKGVREERDYLFNKLSTEKLWLQQENAQLKEQISKAIERLNSKQIRFINEKDYILTDDDLDEIMQIFKINKED